MIGGWAWGLCDTAKGAGVLRRQRGEEQLCRRRAQWAVGTGWRWRWRRDAQRGPPRHRRVGQGWGRRPRPRSVHDDGHGPGTKAKLSGSAGVLGPSFRGFPFCRARSPRAPSLRKNHTGAPVPVSPSLFGAPVTRCFSHMSPSSSHSGVPDSFARSRSQRMVEGGTTWLVDLSRSWSSYVSGARDLSLLKFQRNPAFDRTHPPLLSADDLWTAFQRSLSRMSSLSSPPQTLSLPPCSSTSSGTCTVLATSTTG